MGNVSAILRNTHVTTETFGNTMYDRSPRAWLTLHHSRKCIKTQNDDCFGLLSTAEEF